MYYSSPSRFHYQKRSDYNRYSPRFAPMDTPTTPALLGRQADTGRPRWGYHGSGPCERKIYASTASLRSPQGCRLARLHAEGVRADRDAAYIEVEDIVRSGRHLIGRA